MKKTPGWKVRMNAMIKRLNSLRARNEKATKDWGPSFGADVFGCLVDHALDHVKSTNGQGTGIGDEIEKIEQIVDFAETIHKRKHEKIAVAKASKKDVKEANIMYLLYTSDVGVSFHRDDFVDAVSNYPRTILLTAKNEAGEIIGILLGYDMSSWGYIEICAVDMPYRNRGVAKSLVSAFCKGRRGWSYLEFCTSGVDKSVLEFAKAEGFEPKGTATWYAKKLR